MRCFNMQAKKHKTTLWSRSLVSVTKKPRTCWTVASSTPALRNSAKIAFKKICSCNEAFLSQKTNETKTHLWSSESMKHQEEVWKGKSLAATYLNTGWAVYLTIGCFITACNSGIITFFGEKLVQWKGHKSKGNIFTWLHWHMVMRTFHLWLQSRGPSWQSRGLFSAWPTRRSPWPSCRCPGTAARPPTALPPARECHTCGTTFPNAGDRAEQQPTDKPTPNTLSTQCKSSGLPYYNPRCWKTKLTDQNQQKQLSTSPTPPPWSGHHQFKAELFSVTQKSEVKKN